MQKNMNNKELAPSYIYERFGTVELPETLSKQYLEDRDYKLPRAIFPDMWVISCDRGTANDTYYPESSLRGDPEKGTGLISFNRPYAIPILRDHQDSPGLFGGQSSEVYGRIYHPAQIHSNGTEKYLRCMGTVTHPEAIEAILTGRWLTLSLGSKTESVQCSICKTELQKGKCDHTKGEMYEVNDQPDLKQKCRWVVGPIKGREISFVVSPSDDQARILNPNLKESVQYSLPRLLVSDDKGVFDLRSGNRVEIPEVVAESLFVRESGKVFGGLTSLQPSILLTESRTKPVEVSKEEAERFMREDFIGPGKYLLSGWDHDHTVVLDQRGDGTSTPGQMPPTQSMSPGYMYPTMSDKNKGTKEANTTSGGPAKGRAVGDNDNSPASVSDTDKEEHAHEVLGGRVMKAGYPIHAHDLEPAHAALEGDKNKNVPESNPVEENKMFAAKLVDTENHVEFGLYQLPDNQQETISLLEKVKSMPHTPTEKEQILSRVAAHCKDILPMSAWQKHFGELTSCEVGDPVSITINAENYGMLYTLSSVITSAEKPQNAETPPVEGKVEEQDKVKDPDPEPDIPIIPLNKQPEPIAVLEDNTALEGLEARLFQENGRARYALAHSCALYMKYLKKPLSRGKSGQELIDLLSKRSAESLQDTLDDLLAEIEVSGNPPTQTVPKLTDPTDANVVKNEQGMPPVVQEGAAIVEEMKKGEAEKAIEGIGSGKLSPLFFDEDEEEYSVLGSLFSDLRLEKVVSKG